MNILVTGACGQLGSELRLLAKGSRDRFVFTDVAAVPEEGIAALDITDSEAVCKSVKDNDIQVLVNCAAFTDVEASEDNVERCELINGTAPGILAAAMKEVGGLLVHISTDYVFGGNPRTTPYTEDIPGAPTGAYGLSKLHGEQAVIASGCRHIILRTGWMYSEFGKNFVKTMLRLMASRPSVKVVFDQVGTPTYAADLAGAILQIIGMLPSGGGTTSPSGENSGSLEKASPDISATPAEGASSPSGKGSDIDGKGELDTTAIPAGCVLNYTGEGVCSWYDFAKMIAEYSGNTSCEVLPCHSGEFPSKVSRPSYSVLDKTRIKQVFGLAIPHWTESLRRCLERMGKLKT